MDASLSPLGRLQASFSTKGKQVEDKSMLIRSLSTILHHTSSSTGYARVARAEEALDEEDEALRRFLDGLALIFDSGESGDGAAIAIQVLAQGILLDVVKSSNKHPSVPQHLTLKVIPPESELQSQLEADWPTFFLKWTRFALTPSLHLHFIHYMVTRIHSNSSRRRPTPKQIRMAENLELYTYYFCKEKIRQRLAAVIPAPPKSGYSSPPRLRFRSLFYDDTTLRKSGSGEVDFDGRIPDDALSDGLLVFEENKLYREMPPHLRRQDETWLASMIHMVLPEYTITMFNGHLVLDEGIADVVSHFLINSLAELQYHLDELETMLAMDDSSKNLETNRKYMLRCLNELFRPLSILTSMAHESPTCWSIIRCLSFAFEDRIAEAFEPDSESVSSESDSVESLIEESANDFDYGSPGQPIHEKIWKWLESLTEWTYALHQICHPVGIVNSHLRRGFTIRLWIPELSHPIKQASLEDTLSFVNWDPEDERSLEALQNAALAHRQRCISGAAPYSGPRDMYSVSQRILLGMEDRGRWSNAFEGSVHCQGLLACLIKERIIRSRLVATSRPRCSCCSLLFHILEPEAELYAASSGSRSLPWALPHQTDTPKEVKDAVAKALCTRLKQVLWATTTEERRRAVETSSKVVPPTRRRKSAE